MSRGVARLSTVSVLVQWYSYYIALRLQAQYPQPFPCVGPLPLGMEPLGHVSRMRPAYSHCNPDRPLADIGRMQPISGGPLVEKRMEHQADPEV